MAAAVLLGISAKHAIFALGHDAETPGRYV